MTAWTAVTVKCQNCTRSPTTDGKNFCREREWVMDENKIDDIAEGGGYTYRKRWIIAACILPTRNNKQDIA